MTCGLNNLVFCACAALSVVSAGQEKVLFDTDIGGDPDDGLEDLAGRRLLFAGCA